MARTWAQFCLTPDITSVLLRHCSFPHWMQRQLLSQTRGNNTFTPHDIRGIKGMWSGQRKRGGGKRKRGSHFSPTSSNHLEFRTWHHKWSKITKFYAPGIKARWVRESYCLSFIQETLNFPRKGLILQRKRDNVRRLHLSIMGKASKWKTSKWGQTRSWPFLGSMHSFKPGHSN